jgi:hypothetical protein
MSARPFSRRHFLRAASLALPLSAVSATELTAAPMARAGGSAGAGRGYWDKNTRLTISMWDFSWLHASHPGGALRGQESTLLCSSQESRLRRAGRKVYWNGHEQLGAVGS